MVSSNSARLRTLDLTLSVTLTFLITLPLQKHSPAAEEEWLVMFLGAKLSACLASYLHMLDYQKLSGSYNKKN